jgi:peptide/nickel transport system ATP-binding protein
MFGHRTKPFFELGATLPTPSEGHHQALLEVVGLSKTFLSRGIFGVSRPVVAVADVHFAVDRGEAVALVGESGSGKSTIARILLRLERPDAGSILLDGEDVLAAEPTRASLPYRRRVQMIFQDPFGSLNRTHDVAHHIVRPLLRHRLATKADAHAKAIDLLHTVGLEPAEEFISRRPYELSGGQRQRVAIARALAVDPDLLIADEPTSMLDVSIRMGILTLLARLKTERRLGMLLITHDLASARYLADRVLVLFRGRIVESGPADEVVQSPAHPYTRALLASIADVGKLDTEPTEVEGAVEQELVEEPAGGCPFAPRCPDVMDVCWKSDPTYRTVGSQRVRCHLYPEGGADRDRRPATSEHRGAQPTDGKERRA